MNKDHPRQTANVLSTPIDVIDFSTAIARIQSWAGARESRYVCVCNAHSVVTADSDWRFNQAVRAADMATADGASVAWMLRRLGAGGQRRISGPDLMWHYLAEAATRAEAVFLYGSEESTLEALVTRLRARWPTLNIVGTLSPPFRALSAHEETQVIEHINSSGARTVWVSLGCPKQELWMSGMRGRIQAVMVGVGAAFDFHAGKVNRAPQWMQRLGLEWLHRLASEPRRLWRRYLVTNTAFIVGACRQLLRNARARD